MNKDVIPERLLQLRACRSRNSVAKEIGIRPQTLEKYEKGMRVPPLDIAADIADYYGVSLDWLIGIDEKQLSEKELICEMSDYTGLSEKAVKIIKKMHDNDNQLPDSEHKAVFILNKLLEYDKLYYLLTKMIDLYKDSQKLLETANDYNEQSKIAQLLLSDVFDGFTDLEMYCDVHRYTLSNDFNKFLDTIDNRIQPTYSAFNKKLQIQSFENTLKEFKQNKPRPNTSEHSDGE